MTSSFEFDSDAFLEAALDIEIIDIARANGMTDPESIRDFFLARSDDAAQPSDLVSRIGAGLVGSALAAGMLTLGLTLVRP
jgi:hypothetical protein